MDKMPLRYWLLSLAIAIIFAFFIGYGIEVFDSSPDYNNFCSPKIYESQNETACHEVNGTWQSYEEPTSTITDVPTKGPKGPSGSCNQPYICQENFNNAQLKHDRIVFIVTLIASIIAFGIGTVLSREITSTGLYAGAVFTLLYGTIRYWQHADNLLKFVLLGLALAILVWIAINKLKDQKQHIKR